MKFTKIALVIGAALVTLSSVQVANADPRQTVVPKIGAVLYELHDYKGLGVGLPIREIGVCYPLPYYSEWYTAGVKMKSRPEYKINKYRRIVVNFNDRADSAKLLRTHNYKLVLFRHADCRETINNAGEFFNFRSSSPLFKKIDSDVGNLSKFDLHKAVSGYKFVRK